jgi:hypothetical protein
MAGRLQVAEGEQLTIVEPDGTRILLFGRAEAMRSPTVPFALALTRGRIVVRSAAQPVQIAVPQGRITVASHGLVEVWLQPAVRVAAAHGGVTVEFAALGPPLQLREETEWAPGDAHALAAARRQELERLVGERDATPPVVDVAAPSLATAPLRRPASWRRSGVAERPESKGSAPALVSPAPAAPVTVAPVVRPGVTPIEPPTLTSRAQVAAPALAPEVAPEVAEARLIQTALLQLRRDRDAAGALRTLDQYRAQFGRGALLPEAQAARVEAVLAQRGRRAALELLDQEPLEAPALLELRGQLRLEQERAAEALRDFDAAWTSAPAQVRPGALYGRALCRERLGDTVAARADLELYLGRFPNGAAAAAARAWLNRR